MTENLTIELHKYHNVSGVSETSSSQDADNQNSSDSKKASTVTIPIGQADESKKTDVSEHLDKKSVETLKKRNIKYPKVSVTPSEVEATRNFLIKNAKELGMTEEEIRSISKEDQALYIALALGYEKGQISEEEFKALISKYGNDVIKQKIKESGSITPERAKLLDKEIKKFSRFYAICDKKISMHIYGKTPEETRKLREEYFCLAITRGKTEAQKFLETIKDSVPQNSDASAVNKLFESVKKHVKTYNGSLKTICEKLGYSTDFLQKLTHIMDKTYESVQKNYDKFVNNFWKSPKGQAIKSYTRYLFSSFIEQKKEVNEKESIATEKQEEAKLAEKEAEKAKEEADKLKAKTDAILSDYKADELSEYKQEKVLQSISPRLALQKKWADADLKKAQEIQYDAESAKRLANALLAIAEKSLSFIKARIAAFVCTIR